MTDVSKIMENLAAASKMELHEIWTQDQMDERIETIGKMKELTVKKDFLKWTVTVIDSNGKIRLTAVKVGKRWSVVRNRG